MVVDCLLENGKTSREVYEADLISRLKGGLWDISKVRRAKQLMSNFTPCRAGPQLIV